MRWFFLLVIFITNFIFQFRSEAAQLDSSSVCYKNLQVNFFESNLVYQALSIYQIPQGLWPSIALNLQKLSQQVPERMRRMTMHMVPNPTQYPMQPKATALILKNILHNVFYEVMSKYNVNERPTSDFIFDYIFAQQLPKFSSCFGEEIRQLAPSFE